jgi:hypothetical protein
MKALDQISFERAVAQRCRSNFCSISPMTLPSASVRTAAFLIGCSDESIGVELLVDARAQVRAG